MPRTRPPYPPGFRAEAVELIRSGSKSIAELSRDLSVTDQTLRNWLWRADLDAGRRHDGLTTNERDELRRLRSENRTLRMERDLLKKAAVFFAKDGDRSRSARSRCLVSSTRRRPHSRSPSCVVAWRVHGRLLRLAAAATLCAFARRCSTDGHDSADPHAQSRHLWRTADPRRTGRRARCALWPQARCSADAHCAVTRRVLSPTRTNHPTR